MYIPIHSQILYTSIGSHFMGQRSRSIGNSRINPLSGKSHLFRGEVRVHQLYTVRFCRVCGNAVDMSMLNTHSVRAHPEINDIERENWNEKID